MTALTRPAFSGVPHLVPQGWAIWLEMVMANVTVLRVVLAVKESGQALAFYRDVPGARAGCRLGFRGRPGRRP
jgi:hypothetical protein